MREDSNIRTILSDRNWKRLDLFGRKAYSSAMLQFHIVNYEAILAKYSHMTYSKFTEFSQRVPEDEKDQPDPSRRLW